MLSYRESRQLAKMGEYRTADHNYFFKTPDREDSRIAALRNEIDAFNQTVEWEQLELGGRVWRGLRVTLERGAGGVFLVYVFAKNRFDTRGVAK